MIAVTREGQMHDDATPKRTFEEIEADLAAIMGMTKKTPEEQDAHHLRCDAIHYGKVCALCSKNLEAVWRDN